MRHKSLSFSLVLAAAAACWREPAQKAPSAPVPRPAIVIERAQPAARDPRPHPEESVVGYMSGTQFVPASRIKLFPGQHYKWRIRLPCTTAVEFKETLVEPAPTTWGVSKNTEVTEDQTTAITHDVSPCIDGWVEHGWIVNSDDPPGEYLVTVEIDGFATQRYRVDFY
jgi:hypothetical protein